MIVRFFPFVSLLGCAPSVITEEQEIARDEDIESSWKDEEEDSCPKSWVLTYAVEGIMDVTHTPMDMGNATSRVGGSESDELILRVADDNGTPSTGKVLLTYFNLQQDFSVTIDMFGEYTIASSLLSHTENECGSAIGALESTSLHWAECAYGSTHGSQSWTPDEGANGLGCINDYHVQGNIECIDETPLGSCSDGWLNEGDNLQDYVYAQPLLSIEFDSTELAHFTMHGSQYGVEIPTYSNNRTWLALEGTLKESRLEETPDCLCE